METEEKTASGLFIPDAAQEKTQIGLVVEVGNGRITSNGIVPISIKKDDHVLFGKFSGTEINLDGADYLIFKEDELLGIIV